MKIRCAEREVSTNQCVAIIVSTALAGVVTVAIMAGLLFGGAIAISCWFIALGGIVGALLGFGVSTFIVVKFSLPSESFNQNKQPAIELLPLPEVYRTEDIPGENSESDAKDIDTLIGDIVELTNPASSSENIGKINKKIEKFYEALYIEDQVFCNVPKIILTEQHSISVVNLTFSEMAHTRKQHSENEIDKRRYIDMMIGGIIHAASSRVIVEDDILRCINEILNCDCGESLETLSIVNDSLVELLQFCCLGDAIEKLKTIDSVENSPGKYVAQMMIYFDIFLTIRSGVFELCMSEQKEFRMQRGIILGLTSISKYLDYFIDLINLANGYDVEQKSFQCIHDEFSEIRNRRCGEMYGGCRINNFVHALLYIHKENNALAKFKDIMAEQIDVKSWADGERNRVPKVAFVDWKWGEFINLLKRKHAKILRMYSSLASVCFIGFQ